MNLFNKLKKNPIKHIRKDLLTSGIKERMIADFIAGMTDRFAINLNKNFRHFHKLFEDIKKSNNGKDTIKKDMEKYIDIIEDLIKKINMNFNESKCEHFQLNIRKFQNDLF